VDESFDLNFLTLVSMRLFLFSLMLTFFSGSAFAQNPDPILAKGHYVIVGAFAVRGNAIGFQKKLSEEGIKCAYGFVPSRSLYYVYLEGSTALPACLDQLKVIRMNAQYTDAWVRKMDEESNQSLVVEKTPEPVVVAPVKEEPIQVAAAQPVEEPVDEEPQQAVKVPALADMTLGNMEAFLSLYNLANDRVVEGKVQVIDTERGRLITEVKGNDYLMLPDPKSKSGMLTLTCDAFGYRKVQQEISYKKPLTDSTSSFIDDMGSSLLIKFGLTRYEKGDIHALYNVYFFNDAAVFLPESKFELNELLVMMKENPKYRIRLHGHSNGNYHGKIIKVGPSGNFFSVAEDSNTVMGSAKELSESRAEVIKDYLVANGIDASRMEVKAWGGKRPLHDKKSANAKKNIRVEVEVLGV
jgi:outer membrane protein OmpA-like peptidoglycan-associated protein